jgi:hypothetical protein
MHTKLKLNSLELSRSIFEAQTAPVLYTQAPAMEFEAPFIRAPCESLSQIFRLSQKTVSIVPFLCVLCAERIHTIISALIH